MQREAAARQQLAAEHTLASPPPTGRPRTPASGHTSGGSNEAGTRPRPGSGRPAGRSLLQQQLALGAQAQAQGSVSVNANSTDVDMQGEGVVAPIAMQEDEPVRG